MIRGMHYMCWYRHDWNYHPSLPMKRLQQIRDVVEVQSNTLLWSCLGSAAIGIQYLDKEANEQIPPRLRFYGYLNDKEFLKECSQQGITAFAVIWKAQLWEFPAEFNEDESELLALNKLKGVGKRGWIGIRELSTDRYPKIFPSIKEFFPEGLTDADGNPVEDFLEEFRTVTLEGKPIFSTWLMAPDHEHCCYTPCGNKPSYMQYIRKEIEIMVDAGAPGIHLDEVDSQIITLLKSGCFCKDCMLGFRKYLGENPSDETVELDLDVFDYRNFLLKKGYSDNDLVGEQMDRRFSIPLYRQFVLYNMQGMEQNVAEISDYARTYSLKKRGQAVLFTTNHFHCLPHTATVRKYCDYIIGEKSDIGLRQDGFYRFGHAFFAGKPGSFIEDPNDQVIQIIQDIDQAKNDSYILLMLEPLAFGFNMAIPYGAWLANLTQDSFYPNQEIERQIGAWLKEHEHLFTNQLVAETAILYDFRSALETELFLGGHMDKKREGGFKTFFDLSQTLCNQHILYNVLYVGPDEPLTSERLSGYKNLILPDVYSLPEGELQTIRKWMRSGGRVISLGKVDARLADTRFSYQKISELKKWIVEAGAILDMSEIHEMGFALHQRDGGYALHLVNYRLNPNSRIIETIPWVEFKLGWSPREAKVHAFPASNAEAFIEGSRLMVKNIGIYTIVDLQIDEGTDELH